MPTRKIRLFVETLETRVAPAVGVWTAESFDLVAAGTIPDRWSAWNSSSGNGFHVANGQAIAGLSIASDGGSQAISRAWPDRIFSANTRITAAILANSLIPAELFTRGTDVDGPTPSYYAVSVTRGTEIQLLRVVDGVQSDLATVRTNDYVSGLWLDVTLITQRNVIQARVQRKDTGEWLNPFGAWQSSPAAAVTALDGQIRSKGRAGLSRRDAYSGTVYFDELRIAPGSGDVTAPVATVTIRSLSQSTLKGSVAEIIRFVTRVRSGGPTSRVEYFIDGEPIASRTTQMFAVDFDSRNLENGSHTVEIHAWDKAGNVGVTTELFVVHNQLLSALPPIPQHYSHIRYAALAYSGLTLGAEEQKLLRTSVDLVVPNTRYLQSINAVAPTTPQLIYSNVSNLYLDLLTDWLNFADRNDIPRESAFYHVAQATPFLGDSPSSVPVNWFWNVQRGPANGTTGFIKLTGQSQSPTGGQIDFPTVGGAIYLGYPDRFREVNIRLARTASANWQGVLEYPTQVNSAGQPTGWGTLSLGSDTTAALRRSGTLTFDPPADWQAAVLPGSTAQLFYVRIRTTAGDAVTAPIALTILGRDYVNAHGSQSGIIPAFDSTADKNRDGYLSDAEYANRQPGFDARFAYESRLFYPYYGQMRFVTNPSGNGVAAWAVAYQRKLLTANPIADGIFMDNSGGRGPIANSPVVESAAAYTSDFAALLGAINRRIAPKWVLANTSSGGSAAEQIVRQVPATIEEFALRPMSTNWSQFLDVSGMVSNRQALSDPPGYLILDSLSTGGAPTDSRTRIAALAYYYLLADPSSTFFMTWGGEEPASAWSRHWFDAIAYDVGRPRGSWTQFATGSDPANRSLNFQVFQRTYDNALVLYKPLSYLAGHGTGTTGNSTATTHPLNGKYRALQVDGTLGPVVTSITLRNGEGAILIRA